MSSIRYLIPAIIILGTASLPLVAVSGQPPADLRHGQRLFAQCAACHTGTGSIGPNLIGVVGRRAGTMPGFAYSQAMRRAGFIWDAARLKAFLRDPQATVPGNKMPYGGLDSDHDADDLVAYLAAQK